MITPEIAVVFGGDPHVIYAQTYGKLYNFNKQYSILTIAFLVP